MQLCNFTISMKLAVNVKDSMEKTPYFWNSKLPYATLMIFAVLLCRLCECLANSWMICYIWHNVQCLVVLYTASQNVLNIYFPV